MIVVFTNVICMHECCNDPHYIHGNVINNQSAMWQRKLAIVLLSGQANHSATARLCLSPSYSQVLLSVLMLDLLPTKEHQLSQ